MDHSLKGCKITLEYFSSCILSYISLQTLNNFENIKHKNIQKYENLFLKKFTSHTSACWCKMWLKKWTHWKIQLHSAYSAGTWGLVSGEVSLVIWSLSVYFATSTNIQIPVICVIYDRNERTSENNSFNVVVEYTDRRNSYCRDVLAAYQSY